MDEKEIRELIAKEIDKISKKAEIELNDYKKAISGLCLEQVNANSKLAKDLAAIHESIHAHAIGVQNVYKEMQEMKKEMALLK